MMSPRCTNTCCVLISSEEERASVRHVSVRAAEGAIEAAQAQGKTPTHTPTIDTCSFLLGPVAATLPPPTLARRGTGDRLALGFLQDRKSVV